MSTNYLSNKPTMRPPESRVTIPSNITGSSSKSSKDDSEGQHQFIPLLWCGKHLNLIKLFL
jgi:hypothetical protein